MQWDVKFWQILVFMVCFACQAAGADMAGAIDAVKQQDFQLAAKLFNQEAEKGNAEAQHNLAMILREGKGVEKDVKSAAKWFRKAADQGLADAQYNLGNMYEFGMGLTQNYEYAAVWYKKAAEQGNAMAQTNLGVLYANGQGVKQDIIQAYVWFNLAAAQGIQAAYSNREIVAKELSPEILKNVRAISREYFQKYVVPFQTKPTSHAKRPPPPETGDATKSKKSPK